MQAQFGLVASAWIVCCLAPAAGNAKCATPAKPEEARYFAANAGALLDRFPHGGRQMAFRIQSLAVFGPDARRALAEAVGRANATQKATLAAALASASLECLADAPNVSREIDKTARLIADSAFRRLYAAGRIQTPGPVAAPVRDASDGSNARLDMRRVGGDKIWSPRQPISTPGGSWLDK